MSSSGIPTASPPLIVSDRKYTSTQLNKTDFTKGTVTQLISTAMAVTLNTNGGVITCFTSTEVIGEAFSFTVNNSRVSATSVALVSVMNYTGVDNSSIITPFISNVQEGSFDISVGNGSDNNFNGIITLGFVVI